MLECSHCPKTFRYSSEKIRHEMSHSPGFACGICCKKFSFVSALRRHQKQHERTGSVKCEQCNRKFRDEVLLKRHAKYAHKGTFACSSCTTTFNSDQALRTHLKTHRPESERQFKCSFPTCEKSFNFSHHLKHHELTHTNEKQHYCSVCGKGFIQAHHMKTHLKTHSPSPWLYCKFPGCKKKFSTSYAKKQHMATHKVKPDSGISSDSNSCDASVSSQEYVKDFILCASCGDNVYQCKCIVEHSTRCSHNLDVPVNIESVARPIEVEKLLDQALLTAKWKIDISPKEENSEEVKVTVKIDKDVDGCTVAVGGCIMGATDCVCTRISKPIEENYDFIPIGNADDTTVENDMLKVLKRNNNIDSIDSYIYSKDALRFFRNKENESVCKGEESGNHSVGITTKVAHSVNNICEGCDCASICNIKEPANCRGSRNLTVDTQNVHTVGGVVKIIDTFDKDISINVPSDVKVDMNVNKVSNEFVQFGTCRDVLGNCLVGGSEGCLCARMMIDEQQANAQEIDDITPVPVPQTKTESYT